MAHVFTRPREIYSAHKNQWLNLAEAAYLNEKILSPLELVHFYFQHGTAEREITGNMVALATPNIIGSSKCYGTCGLWLCACASVCT